jgi:predicted permease
MIARAVHRTPEIAIRTSLGAGRWRIVTQLLAESVVIAAGGAIVGLVVSVAGVRLVQTGIPAGMLPYWFDYTMDGAVFATLVGVALASIVVFGVLPALHVSRADVNRTLKDGGRSVTASRPMRVWTDAFLTVQLALAMILLAQVAMVTFLVDRSIPTDRNINTTDVITAAITLPGDAYPDAASRTAFFSRLEERLRARPEMSAQSRTTLLPAEGGARRRVQIRGREQPAGVEPPTVLTIEVAPEYFSALALNVVRGRDFMPSDGTAGAPVAIVNQRFAELFLAPADPLDAAIAIAPATAAKTAAPQWARIVGIAPIIRQQGGGGSDEQSPVVYLPIAASAPATSTLMVRHRVDPATAAGILRTEARTVDPAVALYRVRPLEQAVRDAGWTRHTSAVLADTVTFMSLLLAVVGLYAVTAQRVTLQTREIGVRMALGARSVQIAWTTMRGLRIALAGGTLLGTVGAMAWDGVYSSGVSGVYLSAPPTLLKVAALMAGIVLLACALPTWRAMHTNPITALRHE